MDNEVVSGEKAKTKFNAVKQLIYMQLDSFLNRQQLREKIEMLLHRAVVECHEECSNVLTATIFKTLTDALKLGIDNYYSQSLTHLQKLIYIDKQDFAYEIAGIALTKTLERFKQVEKLEDRLVDRFLNYLAIASVGNLNNTLNHYWKDYVLPEEKSCGEKTRPRFELFEENSNAEGDSPIVIAREINRKIIEKYEQNQQADESSSLQSELMDNIYHNWIVNNSELTKSSYRHLIAVKQSLLLTELMDEQECIEITVSFICQHTRAKNERSVLEIIKICCDNGNCFYQHQARLRVKFKEAILQYLAKRKGGMIDYGRTGT